MLRARVLGAAAVVACGCGQNSPPGPQPGPPAAPGKAGLVSPAVPDKPAPPAVDAGPGEFLRSLKAGTVTAAQLTPAFKKLLAPDAAGGAADWEAGQYLGTLAAGVGTDAVVTAAAGPDATLVTAAGPDGSRRTLVKLVRTPAGIQADWVAVTRHGANVPVTAASLPAAFPALAFVDAVLDGPRLAGRQRTLATALLTPDARDKPSPPLGFRLNRFRGDATTATFAPVPDAAAGVTVTGTLDGPGGKRPFTLKLAKVGDEYRVAEFAAD